MGLSFVTPGARQISRRAMLGGAASITAAAVITPAKGQEHVPDAALENDGGEPAGRGQAIASAPARTVDLGVYQRFFPNDLAGLEHYEARSGQKLTIIHWYALWGGWKSAFSADDLRAVTARGSRPMITWEPWDSTGPHPRWSLGEAVLSGRHDAYIASWARGLAEFGRPVLLRFAHEMHDSIVYPWSVGHNGNTPEQYVAAWRHVRGIFDAYGATNVQWVWNPHTLGDAPPSQYLPTYTSLYPGDHLVDWLGLNIFNAGPALDWGTPYWRSFAEVVRNPYDAITSIADKPVILAEVGSSEVGGSKAEWIRRGLTEELAQFPRVRALAWFDVHKEGELAWNVDSSQDSLEAWLESLPRAARGGTAPA